MVNRGYIFSKKTVRDIALHHKRVLVRADFNVPLSAAGEITSDYRITATIPTLKYLLSRGAAVVVISHLGRPEGVVDKTFSLRPVFNRLRELLPDYPVRFCETTVDDQARQQCKNLKSGELMLLENLRFHPGEEANDPEFAAQLKWVSGADYFVQDGFGVVHRAHASTEAITHLLPAVSGLLLENEVTTLCDTMSAPDYPLVAVIGGAKISDKIGFIERLLKVADTIFIAGAMANTFLKQAGHGIGKSKYEANQEEIIATILQKAKPHQLQLPSEVVVAKEIATDSQSRVCAVDDVQDDEFILDIAPSSMEAYDRALQGAATVIWNGTLGMAELPQFAKASAELAHKIALKEGGITSIIGGGDTADFVLSWLTKNPSAEFTHISTGGGASLELMSGMKLPGVEALLSK